MLGKIDLNIFFQSSSVLNFVFLSGGDIKLERGNSQNCVKFVEFFKLWLFQKEVCPNWRACLKNVYQKTESTSAIIVIRFAELKPFLDFFIF